MVARVLVEGDEDPIDARRRVLAGRDDDDRTREVRDELRA